MSRDIVRHIHETATRVKTAAEGIRLYDWRHEREQIKNIPANVRYTLGQSADRLVNALPPRVAKSMYDAYYFLRRPHYRMQGLSQIERGLEHVAQHIDTNRSPGIPPVEVTVRRRLRETPVTLDIHQSTTRLQLHRGSDTFSVFERYGYGKTDALRITILPPKDTKKRIFRKRPSFLKKVEFRGNNFSGEPVVTRIRWYHTTSRKYITAIENHVRTIQESDTVNRKWSEVEIQVRRNSSEPNNTARETGTITPSPSLSNSSGKYTLMAAFMRKQHTT